jgi:hypothetical protein
MNAFSSNHEQKDLKNCIEGLAKEGILDAVLIPKVEESGHVEYVNKFGHL